MVATPSKDTENDSIGSLDSGLGALTPPPESAGQNPLPFNESAATSSAKKKKKKRKESLGVAGQVVNDNVDSMTMQSAIKTEEASVDATPSSSKKKKKKRSLEKANELGQPEFNTSVVMDVGDIKSEQIETPVSSKKKKKHNKTLDTSELELSHLESQQNDSALVPTSISKKKKKKSKHKDDFIDDLPVETFSIKTEAPGSDDDNMTSLPVSDFQLHPVPAESIKVESQDNNPEESSKKKKRKRKRDESLNMTIAGGETFSSPPAKKKKKHRQSLP